MLDSSHRERTLLPLMCNKILKSSTLPKIGKPTKEMINMGIWFLYSLKNSKSSQVKYLLRIEKETYLLDSKGGVVPHSEEFNVELDKFVYFSDIAQPQAANFCLNAPLW